MIDLFESAGQLQDFCDQQGWRSCFIGGIAARQLCGAAARCPSVLAPQRILLLSTPSNTGIDVSLGALPFEEMLINRATSFTFAPGAELRTCSAEDLVVMKLFASRPLDIRDAEGVAIRNRGRLDWRYIEEQHRPLAEVKQEPEILKTMGRLREI